MYVVKTEVATDTLKSKVKKKEFEFENINGVSFRKIF